MTGIYSKSNQGGARAGRRSKEQSGVVPSGWAAIAIENYLAKCPPNPPDRFYLNLVIGSDLKTRRYWYSAQPRGKTSLSTCIKLVSQRVGLDGRVTTHSLRRSDITAMTNAGTADHVIRGVSGHSSVTGLVPYQCVSHKQQQEVAQRINFVPANMDTASHRNNLIGAVSPTRVPETDVQVTETKDPRTTTRFRVPQSSNINFNCIKKPQVVPKNAVYGSNFTNCTFVSK